MPECKRNNSSQTNLYAIIVFYSRYDYTKSSNKSPYQEHKENPMQANYTSILKQTLLLSSIAISAISLSGCVPVAVVATPTVIVGSNAISTNQSAKNQSYDFGTKMKIMHMVKQDKELSSKANIEASVFNSVVLLLGQVPTEAIKKDFAIKVSKLPHVSIVYDEITVGPIVPVRTYANDGWITTKVKTRLAGKVNPLHFKVITEKGVVYLMGLTTKKEGELASQIASKTSGVKKVVEIYAYVPDEPKGDAKIVKKHSQDTKDK
jgi:osmotically-inducible protein OsmY